MHLLGVRTLGLLTMAALVVALTAAADAPTLPLSLGPVSEIVDKPDDLAFETDAGARQPLQGASDEFGHIDVLNARLADHTDDAVEVSVQLTSLEGPANPPPRHMELRFTVGDLEYTTDWSTPDCPSPGMQLLVRTSPEAPFEPRGCVHVQVLAAENRYLAHIPKSEILRADGAPIGAGDTLEDFYVATMARFSGREPGDSSTGVDESGAVGLLPGTRIVDRAPDAGFGDSLTLSDGAPPVAEPDPDSPSTASLDPATKSEVKDTRAPGVGVVLALMVLSVAALYSRRP